MHEFQNLEALILAVGLLLWAASVFFRRPNILNQRTTHRLVVLAGFIIAFILIFYFSPADIVTLSAVILPLIWSFADSIAQQIGPKQVTLILKSGTGYCRYLRESIKGHLEERLPNVKLKIEDKTQEEDINAQRTILHNELLRHPAAIVIVPPPDNTELIPLAVEALKRKIPLITVDDELEPSGFTVHGLFPPIHVGSQFDNGGREAAQEIINALNGSGRVVIISGPLRSKPSQARKLAFIDEIYHSSKGIQIVACRYTNWSPFDANQQITWLLRSGVRFEGVFCCNDRLAMGVLEALKREQQGTGFLKDQPLPIIIGFDGIDEVYPLIREGSIHASIDVGIDIQSQYIVDSLFEIFASKRSYFKKRHAPALTAPVLIDKGAAMARGDRR